MSFILIRGLFTPVCLKYYHFNMLSTLKIIEMIYILFFAGGWLCGEGAVRSSKSRVYFTFTAHLSLDWPHFKCFYPRVAGSHGTRKHKADTAMRAEKVSCVWVSCLRLSCSHHLRGHLGHGIKKLSTRPYHASSIWVPWAPPPAHDWHNGTTLYSAGICSITVTPK